MTADVTFPRPDEYDTFYLSRGGFIIPTITGTISFIGSGVILLVIIKSGKNTAYHRIMFLMSSADMISSLMIALTTIPMPKDVIYPFQGMKLGTTTTCTIQGSLYLMATAMTMSMNGILNIYYACAIKYRMHEATFKKYVEPILLFLAFVMSVIFPSILLLRRGLINPSPYESYCSVGYYPFHCYHDDNIECIRGDTSVDGLGDFRMLFLVSTGTGLIVLFGTMGLIIYTFYKSEKALRHFRLMKKAEPHSIDSSTIEKVSESTCNEIRPSTSDSSGDNPMTESSLTGIITKQALMYICAFSVTWFFIFLTYVHPSDRIFYSGNNVVQCLKLVFFPLQGFYNMCIFLYLKVYHIQRMDSEITNMEAVRIVFTDPGCVPQVLISRLGNLIEDGSDDKEKVLKLWNDDEKSKNAPASSAHASGSPSMAPSTIVNFNLDGDDHVSGSPSLPPSTIDHDNLDGDESAEASAERNFNDNDLSYAGSRSRKSMFSNFTGISFASQTLDGSAI